MLFCVNKYISQLVFFILFSCVLLSACDNKHLQQVTLPKTPVEICKKVTSTLMDVVLPNEMKINEQEIHGERIVVHLHFQRAKDDPMKSICVYGFDRYNEEGKQQLYRKVPTRMALNDQQISEAELISALKKIGFEL